MMYVYLLWHEHGRTEDWKFLGAFSSETLANSSKEIYKDLPGFRECPEGYTVDRVKLDEPRWTEGYFSSTDEE